MRFDEFYSLLYPGRYPYQWQIELADFFIKNEWKESIRLPMASGKTTTIEIWFYALCENIRQKRRHIPLRLFYIVDRKLLVDEAFSQSCHLEKKLTGDRKLKDYCQPVLQHFGSKSPLVVARLRGGLDKYEKDTWITTPIQPTIISSTIDQYGSRLLFRGYGVSALSGSKHAGLTALDSLVILDEAHISQPFKNLVVSIFKDIKPLGKIPPSRIIEISATSSNNNVFPLSKGDALLRERTEAIRPVSLVGDKNVVTALVRTANKLLKAKNTVAVVCNTVKHAREVFKKLKKGEKVLFIGPVRAVERDKLLKKYKKRLSAERDRSLNQPLIVVCTQTIEVGANFDFDQMISEAAPIDCLIQRFGRMNRFGKSDKPSGFVIYKKSKESLENINDCIYGTKTGKTIQWIKNTFKGNIPNISKIDPTNEPDLCADIKQTPSLTQQLKSLLAHTYPHNEIDISKLLHGVDVNSRNEISIVYRRDITFEMLDPRNKMGKTVCKLVEALRPRNHEIVRIPQSALYDDEFGDIEYQIDSKKDKISKSKLRCVVYKNGKAKIKYLNQIRGGDVIVVPCEFGKYDSYGWNIKSNKRVRDVYHLSGNVLCLNKQRVKEFEFSQEMLDNDHYLAGEIKRLNELYEGKGHVGKLLNKLVDDKNYKFRKEILSDEQGLVFYISRKTKCKLQELNSHMRQVSEYAVHYGTVLGLPDELIQIFKRFGLLHDLGKADPRFQRMLYAASKKRYCPEELLAKSDNLVRAKIENFNAPKGWRHELQSLEMLRDEKNKLLIHLIGSHHGWFRNSYHLGYDSGFKPFNCGDYEAKEPYVKYLGSDLSLFWELNEKYGIWGLAFLETICRLADINASKDGE